VLVPPEHLGPDPRVDSYEELNKLLLERCLAYQAHTIRGRSKTVGEYFAIERDKLIPLPLRRMEPIKQTVVRCNTFSHCPFRNKPLLCSSRVRRQRGYVESERL
jgi:hypothetical protein